MLKYKKWKQNLPDSFHGFSVFCNFITGHSLKFNMMQKILFICLFFCLGFVKFKILQLTNLLNMTL